MNDGNGRPGGAASLLRVPRMAALGAIAVLVAAASAAAFAESYRGLYAWAHEHGLTGRWAVIWPLQVDVFIAVGELVLFVALVDRWAPRSRWAAWAVTGAGLAVSVAGNVGHVAGHSAANRATAALPPVAAAFALAVALGVLKRVVEAHHEEKPETASASASAAASVRRKLPPLREIQARQNCGQETAKKARDEVRLDRLGQGGAGIVPVLAAQDVPARAAPEVPPSLAGTQGAPAGAGTPPEPAPAGVLNGRVYGA